ncbi:hypothetical protein HFO41_31765 [Rhizobium leguminosarum]|uniref:PIN-like domain-containing protein n=1 Tax=Rhizobium leguminosarum TaxID=384 RepID=UPI001C94FFA1|nr:PIN-like domain-containing protein [Rhizobium leguminosarum]MBY5565410.1 hypothetical protein [Rhizobium leguminosarum]MBY5622158.1 hypothetical protein [Rhizobium leguminosarum]MBY5693357.1 hypothetical protein [Rhizobium leguminosarum]
MKNRSSPVRARGASATRSPQPAYDKLAQFFLPLTGVPANDLAAEGADLLQAPRTLVYIDTSFLMWMTRIGTKSRSELIAWLTDWCGARLAVPAWSAHEYYRHLKDRTILEELAKHLTGMRNIAEHSFDFLYPFLDEPLGGASDNTRQLVRTREVLSSLGGLTEMLSGCSEQFHANVREVTTFANAHALRESALFDYFDNLDAVASARYEGRMPPGYQDRKKKPLKVEVEGEMAEEGRNRWGDLIFWREILDHARSRRATAIVVLTRDGKSDWHMAPQPGDDNSTERPAHPSLGFEAWRSAGADKLRLYDNRRLALIAKAAGRAPAFVSVSTLPGTPKPKSEKDLQKEEIEKREKAVSMAKAEVTTRTGFRFLDANGLTLSEPKFKRAMLSSRDLTVASTAPVAKAEAVLANALAGNGTIESLLTADVLGNMASDDLVIFARKFGTTAISDNQTALLLSDFLDLFHTIPPVTSSYLYFGLTLSMYLAEGNQAARLGPAFPVGTRLIDFQTQGFAKFPLLALEGKMVTLPKRPIYIATPQPKAMRAKFVINTELRPPNQLIAVWIAKQQLVLEEQAEPDLKLRKLLGGSPATVNEILNRASEIYCLPRNLISPSMDEDYVFDLGEHTGLKNPSEVWLNELENGND